MQFESTLGEKKSEAVLKSGKSHESIMKAPPFAGMHHSDTPVNPSCSDDGRQSRAVLQR